MLTRQLKQEFRISQQIKAPGIIRGIDFFESERGAVLVLEDRGGRPLDLLLNIGAMRLDAALRVGANLASAVAALHQAGFIHRNIQPHHILLNHKYEVELAGLDSASQAPRFAQKTQYLRMPGLLPAYMSPEISGRTGRLVDYRTDLYSLGVILFQMLSGRLPFQSEDPFELVHAHVAKSPPFLSDIRAEIPQVVATIVQKLLEKSAEDRYQGGWGVRRDLERCLESLERSGSITGFAVAEQDPPSRFELHQGFYGRERESRKLQKAFLKAAEGEQQAVLISGYPGVGKTALVNELRKTVLARDGWFVTGKYGALGREIPYSGLREALLDLYHQVTSDRREQREPFRSTLQKALGFNLGIVLELVPEWRGIFGNVPPVVELDPVESKNRFHLSLLRTLQSLASEEHPLVLFIDDVQWADQSSLELIGSLLQRGLKHFLLIGTYRNSHLHPPNTLLQSMRNLSDSGVNIESITVGPLEMHDVRRYVADSLRAKVQNCSPLADVVFQKSGGNPFYAKEFLNSLFEANLLYLNQENLWEWDLERVARFEAKTDLFEVTRKRMELIPAETRHTVALAAALGHPLDLSILATLCGRREEKIESELIEACRVRILIREGRSYRFEHDRLQESAYTLIPEEERAGLHLRIGRAMAKKWGNAGDAAAIFLVLEHVNRGLHLLENAHEREEAIALNLLAGRKAHEAAAFPAAFRYFKTALGLLSRNCWDDCHETALDVHVRAAEAAFLTADFREAERLAQTVLENCRTLPGKVPAYETLINVKNARLQEDEAFRITLEATGLLGIEIPFHPTAQEIAEALAAVREMAIGLTAERGPAETPRIDEESRAVMKLLTRAALSAGTVNLNLYLAINHSLFQLAKRFPKSPEAPVAHIMAGGILCFCLDEYQEGFRVADLGAGLQARYGSTRWQALGQFILTIDINCWRLPFAALVSDFRTAYRLGLQTGDVMTASTAAYFCCETALQSGMELSRLGKLCEKYTQKNRRLGVQRVTSGLMRLQDVCRSLKDGMEAPPLPPIAAPAASDPMQAWHASADQTVREISICHELMIALYSRETLNALELAVAANQLPLGSASAILPTDFYICLALYDALSATGPNRQDELQRIIGERQCRVAAKGAACAQNHQHRFDLVEAQRLRLGGDPLQAMEHFDRSILGAQRNGFLQDEALANEIAAEFYLELGRERIAALYLREAVAAYGRWGSLFKVDQLYSRYRELIEVKAEMKPAAGASDPVDLNSIERAAGALTTERNLNVLFEKFMEILLQHAGAQKGYLLRHRDSQIVIEAEGVIDEEGCKVLPGDLSAGQSDLSTEIVDYVNHSLETFILGDAGADERFGATPYVLRQKPKSILCSPVLYNGQPVAFIYLENNLARDAFGRERIAAIQVISAHAAIAIENARLLAGLKQEVAIRRDTEENLLRALDEVARLKDKLQAENLYLKEEVLVTQGFDEIVGRSKELQKVLLQVSQVAATEASVLVLGETGTGKELIARAIHNRSTRNTATMVKVNCATLPAGLIESELFGHEKGAFTGAHTRKIGRFELADGGTIFLDEVGELPLDLQAKLLRVLQEGEFERVGSSTTQTVNVRVIAATNRNLKKAAEEGLFRSDLYFRLSVFPLELPPLRERRDDIPLLVWYFIGKQQAKFGKNIKAIPNAVMDALLSYEWPGNIRELENVLERAVILSQGTTLALDETFVPTHSDRVATPPEGKLEEVERQHIELVLAQCGWKVKGKGNAADRLGLNPSTLVFRMKKLGIQRPHQ